MTWTKLRWILALGLCLVAFAIYSRVDPAHDSRFPRCMFKVVTTLDCPGCGCQRAVHQLSNGNLVRAFQINPFLIIALPFVLWGLTRRCLRDFGYDRLPPIPVTGRAMWGILIAICTFWIARNTPLWPFS